ncbi:MAG: universal stress protein [Actinobacteria bacterium]|nr:universal stress protein [Actinomycetota bacterium]
MEDWRVETIVLGYDGSQGGDHAARLAAAIATRERARLVVTTAFPHGYDPTKPGETGEKAMALIDQLASQGLDVEQEILFAPPGEALLAAAERHRADLIVVGCRAHPHTAGVLPGSTCEHVVRRARVPVLVAH